MTTIAFVSAKGSPGVTTVTLSIAATWPRNGRIVVAECDPSGGDLAHRFGLSIMPGMSSMATQSWRDETSDVDHFQQLPGGLSVLVASPASDHASSALDMLSKSGGLVIDGSTVLADCGRLDARSAAMPIVTDADFVVVVTHPTVTAVAHTAALLTQLRRHVTDIGLIVTQDGAYRADEVASALGVELLGVIPFDKQGAGILCGDRGDQKTLLKSPLIRSCQTIGELLRSRANITISEELAS